MNRIFWRGVALSCDAIKHIIGKGDHHLWQLEALLGPFIDVCDTIKEGGDEHIYGPCYEVAMVAMFWHACMKGFIYAQKGYQNHTGHFSLPPPTPSPQHSLNGRHNGVEALTKALHNMEYNGNAITRSIDVHIGTTILGID